VNDESAASPSSIVKMHYTVPDFMEETAHNIPYAAFNLSFEKKERELLQKKGALSILEKTVHEKLIQTYFDCFHPSFPIVDRGHFLRLYETNSVPLLLLHGIYLVAATHCEQHVITSAGWSSRQAARLGFYQRAKALYDADYESDTTTVVQALLLMSFWWGGPLDQKDTWHWLGCAIRLAQTKGMHRSYVLSLAYSIY
jgi:hypothetical protein